MFWASTQGDDGSYFWSGSQRLSSALFRRFAAAFVHSTELMGIRNASRGSRSVEGTHCPFASAVAVVGSADCEPDTRKLRPTPTSYGKSSPRHSFAVLSFRLARSGPSAQKHSCVAQGAGFGALSLSGLKSRQMRPARQSSVLPKCSQG